MWRQILAIGWAQFRITRNHLPRTSFGTVLISCVSLLWYGLYVGFAVFLSFSLPRLSLLEIRQWLPVGLLSVFLFWQVVPLFTLSSGWSLQLNKLQVYPVSSNALFGIEVVLRITSAPEMVIVLVGALIGLVRHPGVPFWGPLFLLLYVPFNLLLLLAIRDLILHSFERNRFRELFAALMISIGVLPQVLLRTGIARRFSPYFLSVAQNALTPWHEIASLSLGSFSPVPLLTILAWTAAGYAFARFQFQKSLSPDDSFRPGASAAILPTARTRSAQTSKLRELPARVFNDPMAALLQKELQSLVRMPRFRVIFGMACIFSVLIFIPFVFRNGMQARQGFWTGNFLPVVNLYGLLLMSDALLLNIFGFDRRAAQIFFVVPVPFETVLRAKNLTAVIFIALQTLVVLVIASVLRIHITLMAIASDVLASAVVTVFLLSLGNFVSVTMARPLDATQTFKKQAGAKMQLWLLLCSVGIFLLIGFALLARYALHTDWALLGVLVLEFCIGLIFYRAATESAVQRGLRDREQMLDALAKTGSPVGLG
jgi:ABC-2 type transport system permease protein